MDPRYRVELLSSDDPLVDYELIVFEDSVHTRDEIVAICQKHRVLGLVSHPDSGRLVAIVERDGRWNGMLQQPPRRS